MSLHHIIFDNPGLAPSIALISDGEMVKYFSPDQIDALAAGRVVSSTGAGSRAADLVAFFNRHTARAEAKGETL